jgi:hypothetical protein
MAQDSERAGGCGAIVDLNNDALADEGGQGSWTGSRHFNKKQNRFFFFFESESTSRATLCRPLGVGYILRD